MNIFASGAMMPDRPTPSTRVRAVATCVYCTYVAELTRDNAIEVATTLRRLVLAHVAHEHPERTEPRPS